MDNKPKIINTEHSILATHDISAIIDKFVDERDIKDISRKMYRSMLIGFFAWINDNQLQSTQFTRATLIKYKEDLMNSQLSMASVGSRLVVLRTFYKWLHSMGLIVHAIL